MRRDERGDAYYDESDVMFWVVGSPDEPDPDETVERELRAEARMHDRPAAGAKGGGGA